MTKVEAEVTLFLFGPAYTRHWKTPVASVIGLMNPNVMKNDKVSCEDTSCRRTKRNCHLVLLTAI